LGIAFGAIAWMGAGFISAAPSQQSAPLKTLGSRERQVANTTPRDAEAVHPVVVAAFLALASALALVVLEPARRASPSPTRPERMGGPHFPRHRRVILFVPANY
jgi:hypothetical protein